MFPVLDARPELCRPTTPILALRRAEMMIENSETVFELPLLAQLLNVPLATMQDWIDAGLEHEWWQGRVLTSREALQRFHQSAGRSAGQRHVA